MSLNIHFFISTILLQESTITQEEAQAYADQAAQLELSRLTTILSIALITVFVLMVISLYKISQLQKENNRLRSQIAG